MSTDLPLLIPALREALEAGDGYLPAAELEPASRLLAKAAARGALGDATVVALGGATGSGKSTLFNAFAGENLATTGVLRPTTSSPQAVVWGDPSSAGPLLDWLGVRRRHHHTHPEPDLDGLVLVDMPDHDSTASEHRIEVDRLVELVDVLVWVLDPQKYADAAIHDQYLRPFHEHLAVLLVVLNHADRLDESARTRVAEDLRDLLDREGLGGVPLLVTSGRTGLGLGDLRSELARRISERRAATERLAADVHVVARALDVHCGSGHAGHVRPEKREALIDAFSSAAGLATVTSAVERSIARRGSAVTGWPPLRWVSGFRPDPLRRLHLGRANPGQGRTSVPEPTRTQQALVAGALRDIRESAGDSLPEAWRSALRQALRDRERGLTDALDQAVALTDLDADRPAQWWGVVSGLQWLFLLGAFVGALWLLGLAGLAYLQLDEILPLPRIEGFPLPTLLLVLNSIAGAMLAALCGPFVRAGARRRAKRAGSRIRRGIERVADESVLAPLEEVGSAHRRYCAALARIAADAR